MTDKPIHLSVNHPGPFYCPHCNARMMDTGGNIVKCLMLSCKNYSISWNLPKVILTKTADDKR